MKLVTRGFELVTRELELVTRVLVFHTAAGIDSLKIYAEKCKTHKETSYKNFHLVWDKVRNISRETLKPTS